MILLRRPFFRRQLWQISLLAWIFLWSNEDAQRACAIVHDPTKDYPAAQACSGINSAFYPTQFAAIAALPQSQRAPAVEEFYQKEFWNKWFQQLASDDVAMRVFDMAVNGGPGTAVKLLQHAVNSFHAGNPLTVDGGWGPITVAARIKPCMRCHCKGYRGKQGDMTYLNAAKILTCLALSYLCVTVGIVIWRAGNAFNVGLAGSGNVIAGVSTALGTINRSCAPGPCGTLASLNKTIVKIGDAVVTTQLQERAVMPHTIAAMDTFNNAAQKLGETVDSIADTSQALTGTANAATVTLQTTGTTIAAFQPVLSHADAAVTDLDMRINDPHVTSLVAHLEGMSVSGDKMMVDAQWKTHQLLHPDKVKLGFWGTTWAGIQAIHKLEPPIF